MCMDVCGCVCVFKCADVLFLRGFVYFVLRPNRLIFQVKSCSCTVTARALVRTVFVISLEIVVVDFRVTKSAN